jgi:hypothetical protein
MPIGALEVGAGLFEVEGEFIEVSVSRGVFLPSFFGFLRSIGVKI